MTARAKTRHEERVDTIITLLRNLRDAGETLQRGDGGGKIKFESRVMMMPRAWHAGCPPNCVTEGTCRSTYAALEAALATLYRMGPRHHWHVAERYVRSERLTHDFVNVGGAYFEAVKLSEQRDGAGFMVTFRPGAPKARNVEIMGGVAQPRVSIVRKPGVRSVFVRAVIERWDAGVESRPLATGLDALASLMPATIRLPRQVQEAA